MAYHRQKDNILLTWMENRELIKLKLRQITRRVEEAVLSQLSSEFDRELAQGNILQVNPTTEELRQMVLDVAQAELEN